MLDIKESEYQKQNENTNSGGREMVLPFSQSIAGIWGVVFAWPGTVVNGLAFNTRTGERKEVNNANSNSFILNLLLFQTQGHFHWISH